MLLTKKQLNLHQTASKDDSRPVLEQIYVRKIGDEIVAVSTDSYVLAEIREQAQSVEDYPNATPDVPNVEIESAFVQADVAKKIIPLLPKKTSLPVLAKALLQKDELITTDLEKTTKFITHEQEGKYPEYEKLIPEPAEKKIHLDPSKLKQVLEVFKDEHSLTIEFGEKPTDPVVLRGGSAGTKITAVVMPLRS